MINEIFSDWEAIIDAEKSKPYYSRLMDFIKNEYENYVIYPEKSDIFNAFKYTSYKDTRVVILGQDPYHEPGQAHGLAFSVKQGVKIPKSLMNIYKELNAELNTFVPNNGNLVKWAHQGVLLINNVLTVREHMAGSHECHGWEEFTDNIFLKLNEKKEPVVFLLWGSKAEKKSELITNPKHLVLKSVHPSPLSAYRGFFGCGHFAAANEFLVNNGRTPIDWQIENI